ncbi:hypothetical protein NA56DRAFT_709739 [Hyaloscypha hepaticicola]|uniref:Uncharacterized protein n=1 Tax=Hyaloscypha hepaticicola TaxID=2082293 RepID=A0A2J6PNM6_9HELO|nr:hypothetical protein NA56DRAFT_709739 [Hyaloscypha hepaticicola]
MPPQHGSSQGSSSQHAAGPAPSRYYVLCEHIANHLPPKFKVHRGMSVVIWSGPQAVDDPCAPVTLWVQARNHQDPKPTRTEWEVEVPQNGGLVDAIKRLVRRGFPEGPQGSIAVFTDDTDGSSEALFQFRVNKNNKDKVDDPLKGAFIPEPEPPEVIIEDPNYPLVSLAGFFFSDYFFDVWEGRIADRKFVALNKKPHYSLMKHGTYWMVENRRRTKKVNIALYLAQDDEYKGDTLSIIINKPLLVKLLGDRGGAKNGTGEPGLHHLKGLFIWQLTEGVKDNFAPPEVLGDSSSSSSSSPGPSSSSSSSGASPDPGPGPSSSQKRVHSRSGSDTGSKKAKVGISNTFGIRPSGSTSHSASKSGPNTSSQHGSESTSKKTKIGSSEASGSGTQGTSASGSHQPSGSSSHSASKSGPHTSSQHGSQHNLSDKFDKNLKN